MAKKKRQPENSRSFFIVSTLRKISVMYLFWGFFLLIALLPNTLTAQYQKKPPDFGSSYSFPTPLHPEPAAGWLRALDVGLLAIALGAAVWMVHKSRNRRHVLLLSIASVAYFGFFRKGCICSVGSIQNVVLCLVNPHYIVSFSVIAIFFLPLLVTLLFGRVFCGGVCPLGAIQDLVVLKPLKVPVKLDNALRWLQYIYLGLAIFFAGWGLQMKIGASQLKMGQRFLICEWDPFIPIFRRSGPFYMIVIAAAFIAAGMFIGRPYCRWLCPYGGILSLLSRVAWKHVRISPDKELDCGLCADACPYGAIHNLRADSAECMACSRCYDSCPRQKRWVALRAGPRKAPLSAPTPPRRWEAVVRTWAGVIAICLLAGSIILLLSTYVRARLVIPAEKALVLSLKDKSKTDAEIQKVLQPELDRQHKAGVARRLIYDRGGGVLIISGALLMLWFSWLRPKHGAGAGVPGYFLSILERPPDPRKKV
jgi:polyferredoxin